MQFLIAAFKSFSNTIIVVIFVAVLFNFSNLHISFNATQLPWYQLLRTLNAFHSLLFFFFRFMSARIDCNNFVQAF